MKEIKLAFRFRPEHPNDLLHIADFLVEREQQILIDLNAVLDREDCQACKQFIEEHITLEINDYKRPRSRRINYHRLMQKARDLRDKYEDHFRNGRYLGLAEIISDLCRCDGRELHERDMEELSNWLEERNNLPGDLREDLDSFIDEFAFIDLDTVASYNYILKTITLYINYFYGNGMYDQNKVLAAFAHEIFHAYHFHLLEINRRESARHDIHSKKQKDEILKESLATFFECYHLSSWGMIDTANDIENGWRRYSPYVCPYAGVRFVKDDQHFKRIVDASVIGFREGYRSLKYDLI